MKEIDGTEGTAAYINRPPATLRWWRHVNEGPPSFKLGKRICYRKSDVDRWIQEQYVTSMRGGPA